MDVHKDSIDIALADAGVSGEVRHCGTIGGGLGEVDRALRKVKVVLFAYSRGIASSRGIERASREHVLSSGSPVAVSSVSSATFSR
jgi:hypothetical protein